MRIVRCDRGRDLASSMPLTEQSQCAQDDADLPISRSLQFELEWCSNGRGVAGFVSLPGASWRVLCEPSSAAVLL